MTGAGRLASVEAIATAVRARLGIEHDLEGETVIVYRGPDLRGFGPGTISDQSIFGKDGLCPGASGG